MPKLPDKNSLGEPASARGARGILTANDFDTGSIVGQGFKKVGAGLNALSDDVHRQSQEDDALDLLKADAYHKVNLIQKEREFDTDPDHSSYDMRFTPQAGMITEDAAKMIKNPKAREKWMIRAGVENEGVRNRVLDRSTRLAKEQKVVDVENIIGDYRKVYDAAGEDLDMRGKALGDIDGAIGAAEKTGLVDPSTAASLRAKHLGGTLESYYRGLIDSGENEKALDELESIKDPAFKILPAPIKRGANVGRPRNTPVKGFVVHETQGSDTMEGNGSWSNKKNTGANYYIDKQGQVFQWAPDDVVMNHSGVGRGVKGDLRPDLGNANTLSVEVMTRPGEKPNETQNQALRALIRTKADEHGFTAKDVEAHGRLAPGHKEITEGVDSVEYVRKNWGDKPVQVADASGNPHIPEKTGPDYYRYLTPDRRKALIYEAKKAGIDQNQTRIKGALDKIRNGAEPDVDQNGKTVFETAPRFLERNQIERINRQRAEAEMERDAVLPLKDMNDDDAAAHIAKFFPSPTTPDAEFESMMMVHDKAKKQFDKIQDARKKDAAGSILDAPDYQDALKSITRQVPDAGIQTDENGNLVQTETGMAADPDDRRRALGLVFQARLDAQDKRGVPEYGQRILTKKEAADLLQMPSPATMEPKAYRKGLEDAAERAHALYGPDYAKKAIEDAIGFQRGTRDKEKHGIETRILRQIATGEGVTSRDVRQYQDLQGVDKIGRFLDFQSQPADDTKPYIGQKTPTEQHVQWLKANIADPGAIATFDGKFGEGAAARALYAKQDKTTSDMGLPQPAAPQKSLLQSLFGN